MPTGRTGRRDRIASSVLGVIVVNLSPDETLDSGLVEELADQTGKVLLVLNSRWCGPASDERVECLQQPFNSGVAAAWNLALQRAQQAGQGFLYLIDDDSSLCRGAVEAALALSRRTGAAAVVQPSDQARRLLQFPWGTVASGSLVDVGAALAVGGFDETLFVDEVDHDLFDRLMQSGRRVEPLDARQTRHQAGRPTAINLGPFRAWASGHHPDRRWMQGRSMAISAMRRVRSQPRVAAGLAAVAVKTMTKDLAAGRLSEARALLGGAVEGVAAGTARTSPAARSCPFCQGPLLLRYRGVDDWLFGTGVRRDVYRCARCRSLAQGSLPTTAELASWYTSYYTHDLVAGEARRWSRWWPTAGRTRERRRLLRALRPDEWRGTFLDVGTGAGERLVTLAEDGWTVQGQDVDPAAGRVAREAGLPVHWGPVTDLIAAERRFDVVALNHVLEHATDPLGLLQECCQLLAPGGRLAVVTPNASSLGRRLFGAHWFGLDQPRHISIATPRAMAGLAPRMGLTCEALETSAANASVIIGGSLTRCAAALPGQRAPTVARFAGAVVGQAIGRAGLWMHPELGEELVWVGRKTEPAPSPG